MASEAIDALDAPYLITEEQLQDKIRAWVREYGDSERYENGSGNILAVLIDHKGFIPNSSGCFGLRASSVADEVEEAIKAMAATPGLPGHPNECFRWAMALRAHYLTPRRWPEEECIKRLGALGLPMSKSTYYRAIRKGREFLAGYFNALRLECREKVVRCSGPPCLVEG